MASQVDPSPRFKSHSPEPGEICHSSPSDGCSAELVSNHETVGTFTEDLIERGAVELKELCSLREKSRSYLALDQRIDNEMIDKTGFELFKRMKGVFQEIGDRTRCLPSPTTCRFLDLECCPGSFSSYILNKDPHAAGVGISPAIETGGYTFNLEQHLRSRLELHLLDITRLNLSKDISSSRDLKKFFPPPSYLKDFKDDPFDLIILDECQPLASTPFAPSQDRALHQIAQIVLALQSIRPGGDIILKLTSLEDARTARLLYMFDTLSLTVITVKPSRMNGSKESFYAVAHGVGRGPHGFKLPELLEEMRKLWRNLAVAKSEGRERNLLNEDLDFLMSTEEMKTVHSDYLDRLVKLGRPVWKAESSILEELLDRSGTSKSS